VRVISYHVYLSSSKCNSYLTGVAKFYSANEIKIVDFEFLPNGHVVKTNMFENEERYGGLDLIGMSSRRSPNTLRFTSRIFRILTVVGASIKAMPDTNFMVGGNKVCKE